MQAVSQKKLKLRSHFRLQRKVLSQSQRTYAAAETLRLLKPILESYHTIASFHSFGDEIDMTAINMWITQEKTLLFPCGKTFRRAVAVSPHASTYTQPLCTTDEPHVECILVPGLVFDRVGYRLGYGKGIYDALLAAHPHAHTIGIALHTIEALPIEAHDMPVNTLVVPRMSPDLVEGGVVPLV